MRKGRGFLAAVWGIAWVWTLSARPVLALADAPPDQTVPPAPQLRLPRAAEPTGYSVDLTIDPGQKTFRGAVDIDLRFLQKTDWLWLNGKDLQIEKAWASVGAGSGSGSSRIPVRAAGRAEEFVGFAFDRPIEPGNVRLHVEYTGALDETSTQGVFRQKDGEDWYVFTQFESTDARRAFPCFDEPSIKVAWNLTLRIPKGTSAVSNTPIVSETEEDGNAKGAAGKVVRFAKTPPLPSYLVAFAVGPFDFVDAGKAGARKIPIRIVTPRGKASQARYAAQTTGPLLEKLEAYFGIPYPYAKLDQLAILQTVTFGAMENAGLITWAEPILLASPAEETIDFQREQASINAHEMAHQWFGDLVTLAWWDDVWLNESFATWMGDRTIIEWKPQWHEDVRRVRDTSNVMFTDALVSTRKVRQEIASVDDIENAFDPISYQKGAAILAMFESWIGVEEFRAGVHAYLEAHANGNATERDFLQAIEAASRPGVAAAFSTFLDQPGVPVIGVGLDCGGGSARLSLTQKRLLPLGSKGSTEQVWRVPVCLRAAPSVGEKDARACTLLSEPGATAPAPGGSCPAWILANDGELGYYRALYQGDLLPRLLGVADTKLSIAERVGLIRDIDALGLSSALPMSTALALVPRFGKDADRQIVTSTLRISGDVLEHLVPDDFLSHYARFISRVYGERARALGFTPKPGEDDETRLLRADLVPFVARVGDEPGLQAEAKHIAVAWLKDRHAIDAELVSDTLAVAAHFGDAELFDRFVAALKQSPERRDRRRLFRALGEFRQPELVGRALTLALSDEVDSRESGILIAVAADTGNRPEIVWDFFKEHYDALLARRPRESVGELPEIANAFCDPAHRQDVADFFQGRIDKLPGGARNLAQTLESIDLCIALRTAQEGSVKEFLSRY